MNLPEDSMSDPDESMDQRRAHLAATIARQRGELAEAYRNLEKPIHYAEYGMRGFGFLRQNPWLFAAVPAVFSIGSSLVGLRKTKAPKLARGQRQDVESKPKGMVGLAVKLGGHGWKLFQLYRRVRKYIP